MGIFSGQERRYGKRKKSFVTNHHRLWMSVPPTGQAWVGGWSFAVAHPLGTRVPMSRVRGSTEGGFSFRPKSLVKIAGTERRPITGRQRNHNSRHYSVAIFPAPSAGVGPTLSVNVLSFQTSLETWTTVGRKLVWHRPPGRWVGVPGLEVHAHRRSRSVVKVFGSVCLALS